MEAANGDRRGGSIFAFSILNLLLGSGLLVAVISHVTASRELNTLKREVKRLRAELGYLDIKDPKKCYVINVPQIEQNQYLFRIYLPPGHSYVRKSTLESKSSLGVSSSGGMGTISESGEFTLRVKIYRDEAGVVRLALNGMGSGSTMQLGKDSAMAAPGNSTSASLAPSKEAKEIEPGQPIELITLEVQKSGDAATKDVLKVWLEDPSQPLTPGK